MRRYVGIVILAFLVGAGCWFFGLGIPQAILIAFVVAAAGVALRIVIAPPDNYEWPPGPPITADGERHDASQLGWALRTPRGMVEDRVIERVRIIAVTSLGRRHLDLDNRAHRAKIEALIGAPLYDLLTSPNPPRVGLVAFSAVLSRLEYLEKTDPAARN